MVWRFREEGQLPPVYGSDSSRFTVELHHGGFFCGVGANHSYVDGKVCWCDDLEAEWWCYLSIEEIMLMLDYGLGGPNMKVYWLLPGKDLSDGLRIVASDEETVVMKQLVHKVKKFILYFDHHNNIADLPKVMSPKRSADHTSERMVSGSESEEDSVDSDFVDSDYEVDDGDDDLIYDNVDEKVIDQGAAKGKKIGKGNKKGATSSSNAQGTDFSFDDEILELPESDEEGDLRNKLKSFRPEDMSNPIFKLGMMFGTVQGLRDAITEYSHNTL